MTLAYRKRSYYYRRSKTISTRYGKILRSRKNTQRQKEQSETTKEKSPCLHELRAENTHTLNLNSNQNTPRKCMETLSDLTSCEPWEKLRRAMFMPAFTISCSLGTARDAGPEKERERQTQRARERQIQRERETDTKRERATQRVIVGKRGRARERW